MSSVDQAEGAAPLQAAGLSARGKHWLILGAATLLVIHFVPAAAIYLGMIWIANVPFSLAAPTFVACAVLCGLSIASLVLVLKKKRFASALTIATLVLSMAAFVWQVHFGEPDMTTTPIGTPHYEYEKHYFTWWWYSETVRL